jgi:hypothetical protein
MVNQNRKILIDADVVSHFIRGGEIDILYQIFPFPIHLLDKVYVELSVIRRIKDAVDFQIKEKRFTIMEFPEENEKIKKEYFHIKKVHFKGDGESACLAVVRYNNDILASSNLKDIKRYCELHSIDYLTTMDFLCEALKTGKMDLIRCNNFISKVIIAGSKLPVKQMENYNCRVLNI